MAGGWYHVTSEEGELSEPRRVADMLENHGDVFEAVAELHGMVAWLAYRLAVVAKGDEPTRRDVLALIDQAREQYGDVVVRGVDLGNAGTWRNL